MMLFMPIFHEGRLFGFAASKAHLVDVGAKDPYPTDSTDAFQEGLRIPPVKLYRGRRARRRRWRRSSSRTPGLQRSSGEIFTPRLLAFVLANKACCGCSTNTVSILFTPASRISTITPSEWLVTQFENAGWNMVGGRLLRRQRHRPRHSGQSRRVDDNRSGSRGNDLRFFGLGAAAARSDERANDHRDFDLRAHDGQDSDRA